MKHASNQHPDAGDMSRNHYDWFMPDDPTADVDANLDAFEAKMREALTDPFVHDMAHSVLPLIAAYREARRPLYDFSVLRERLAAATPGPWKSYPRGEDTDIWGRQTTVIGTDGDNARGLFSALTVDPRDRENAALIVEVVNALPALLGLLEGVG